MLRTKTRSAPDACADCGAHDATWASVNRGVLLCDECCSVHRSLGRHVSQVKSLSRDVWTPAQLAMVHTLNASGANNIWEHSLLSATSVKSGPRKPTAKDPISPVKSEFIRAKYQNLNFVMRPTGVEQPTEDDLGKQLHSSVRTSNLETCLRQLSLGADPNYFHPEKGSRPLHVAAKAGQPMQVELLLAHGADPGAHDWNGNTPVHYARSSGHIDLAHRLADMRYELTDRLAQHVCGRKPDHLAGQHLIVPEMADSMDLSEFSKLAKRKLQALNNTLFEELAMDVYDEVDRRHTDEMCLSTLGGATTEQKWSPVPFLPVNPEFSSTRNQGRQKLARFNAREFATLVIDVLGDVKRRQLGLATSLADKVVLASSQPLKRRATVGDGGEVDAATLSDDEPLYDTVATSDDEEEQQRAARVCQLGRRTRVQEATRPTTQVQRSSSLGDVEEGKTTSVTTVAAVAGAGEVSAKEYEAVNRQLAVAEARIQQLQQNNASMKQEIGQLHAMVQTLMHENLSLKSQVQLVVQSQSLRSPSPPLQAATTTTTTLQQKQQQLVPNGHEPPSQHQHQHHQHPTSSSPAHGRPQSMYEPRQHRRQHSHGSGAALLQQSQQQQQRSKDDGLLPLVTGQLGRKNSEPNARWPRDTTSEERDSGLAAASQPSISGIGRQEPTESGVPTQEQALARSRPITYRIQELHALAKGRHRDGYVTCAEKIHAAVLDLAGMFPDHCADDRLHQTLADLTGSALRLHADTKQLLRAGAEHPSDEEEGRVATQIVGRAYDTTKAVKDLITLLH